ncbi:MAG: hypothetical protein Q4C55_08110 [Eubacterium sp.]|nr:hypothetical protein [Eubacterium sp.]
MPSVRVLGNRFTDPVKERVARALCSDLKRILKAPIGETYFEEFDKYYVEKETFTVCDGTNSPGCVTLIINGPVLDQEGLQELCAALTDSFQKAVGDPDYEVIFVYHPIDGNHIGSKGQLHALRGKGKKQ